MPVIWKTIFLLINHLSYKPSLNNDSNVEYPGRFVFSIGSNLSDVDCNILNELGTAPCELPRIITKIEWKSCEKYYREWSSFECENVPLSIPSGGNSDPHFTTLDDADLLRADFLPNSTTLEIQIRTKSVQSDSDENPATVIVRFVII